MLSVFSLKRVGFNKKLSVNDMFKFDNDDWIIRHISKIEVKERIVEGFFGKRGIQKDVIIADVVAQKKDTFNLANRETKLIDIESTVKSGSKCIPGTGSIITSDNIHYFSIKK